LGESDIRGLSYRFIARALLLLIIFVAEVSVVDVQAKKKAIVTGTVVDENGSPISGANVTLLTFNHRPIFKKRVTTDAAGRFYASVDEEGSYLIYVTYDDKVTPGMDYVPERWRAWLSLDSVSSRKFILKKGASIYLDGEIRCIKTNKVATGYLFIVLDLKESAEIDYWREYGSFSDFVRALGFDERLVIVPADTEVKIEVIAEFPADQSQTFILEGKAGYFKLLQGEVLRIDVKEQNILSNVEYVKGILSSGFSLLHDCRTAGFLVETEKRGLLNAYSEVEESLLLLRKRLFDHSFAKLRSAYILSSEVESTLKGLIQSSSQSLLPSFFLFLFIAFASAHLIVEGSTCLEIMVSNRKFLISINSLVGAVFYIFLITLFYYVFPGCRLILQSTYIIMSIFTFISGKIVALLFVRFSQEEENRNRSIQFKSAITAAFSLGSRNLRRRKMRTLINLTSIVILVFGFITLTSISPGYGLSKIELRPSLPVDALLIRDEPLGASPGSFISLPESFIEWLESYPNVTLISPKAENSPVTLGDPLGRLYSEDGKWMNVLGIIGIIPSREANITGIDRMVEEGNYLEDNDLKGILISSSLQESLKVNVGDKLYGFGQEFIIRGFFDDEALKRLVDIHGLTFLPYVITDRWRQILIPCPESNIIITNYKMALTLPRVSTSRVAVQLYKMESYESLAKIIALTYEYKAYVSHQGSSLTLYSLEKYVEAQGVELIFPLMVLVMLNIGLSMFATINERRNEITSLSSLGLNPTHIAALFVAEALIIGFIGGGVGYLLGISGYRLASLLGGVQVREKVSAEWGISSIFLSVFTATIASLIPALRSSTLVTPSLLRKWKIEESEHPIKIGTDKRVLDLPIKLMSREVEPFAAFIVRRLREDGSVIKLEEETSSKGMLKRISFVYDLSERGWTENEIVIQPEEKEYGLKLVARSHSSPQPAEAIRKTTTYVRKIILEWSAVTCEVLTSFDPYLNRLYNLVNVYSPTTLYIISTYPDTHDKINRFRDALISRGIRPPKFFVSHVDPLDLKQTMKTVKDLVSRADIVCVSGENVTLCTVLTMEAVKQNKTISYVIDDRSVEDRIKNPFQDLKIISIS